MMINFDLWISFVATVIILAITPGPSVLLATANSMNHGLKNTLGTILGDLSANLIQIFLASVGLASILLASNEIFQLMKWVGVGYLIYMGVRKWINNETPLVLNKSNQGKSFLKLYSQGFLVSASNPKAIIFFAALFPVFIDPMLPFITQIIILAITFICIDGITLLIYAHFATRLKSHLQNKKKLYLQNRIIGSLLIGSGILLSFVRKSNN